MWHIWPGFSYQWVVLDPLLFILYVTNICEIFKIITNYIHRWSNFILLWFNFKQHLDTVGKGMLKSWFNSNRSTPDLSENNFKIFGICFKKQTHGICCQKCLVSGIKFHLQLKSFSGGWPIISLADNPIFGIFTIICIVFLFFFKCCR